MKTAIVYASVHHQNTKKLLDAIAAAGAAHSAAYENASAAKNFAASENASADSTSATGDNTSGSSSDAVTLIDATKQPSADLTAFDRIGFASGIYYSKFHKTVLKFAEENLPEGKDVFFIYTAAAPKDGQTKSIATVCAGKKANVLGEYGCAGFNTYGPFKLVGGIAKGHPSEAEIAGAVEFYNSL